MDGLSIERWNPRAPLQVAALSGKIAELSDEDRNYVESLVDRLLTE